SLKILHPLREARLDLAGVPAAIAAAAAASAQHDQRSHDDGQDAPHPAQATGTKTYAAARRSARRSLLPAILAKPRRPISLRRFRGAKNSSIGTAPVSTPRNRCV